MGHNVPMIQSTGVAQSSADTHILPQFICLTSRNDKNLFSGVLPECNQDLPEIKPQGRYPSHRVTGKIIICPKSLWDMHKNLQK